MNKAEKYIQDCTRNCSNALLYDEKEIIDYEPWLTPDDARKAMEIAREEIYEWLSNNILAARRTQEEEIARLCMSIFDYLSSAIKESNER